MSWLKSGVERLLEAMQKQDLEAYHSAYDDCLWRVTTSGKDELEEFVNNARQAPYCNLPTPLLVLMCRLYILESRECTTEVENGISFIVAHCSLGEEKGATGEFSHLLGYSISTTVQPGVAPNCR